MDKMIIASLVASLAWSPVVVHAHGDEHKTSANAATKKEQKEWGIAGDRKLVKRTFNVSMTDQMRFHPDKIELKQGETIRIVLKNTGTLLHEMVIGTKKELE